MILVGTVCAVLWVIGWAMSAPKRQRWGMIAVVFVGVILAHLILPDGHPLRNNTGGSWELWAIIAAFASIIWIYRLGLRRLTIPRGAGQCAGADDSDVGRRAGPLCASHRHARDWRGRADAAARR